jgi:hypothetical protein
VFTGCSTSAVNDWYIRHLLGWSEPARRMEFKNHAACADQASMRATTQSNSDMQRCNRCFDLDRMNVMSEDNFLN